MPRDPLTSWKSLIRGYSYATFRKNKFGQWLPEVFSRSEPHIVSVGPDRLSALDPVLHRDNVDEFVQLLKQRAVDKKMEYVGRWLAACASRYPHIGTRVWDVLPHNDEVWITSICDPPWYWDAVSHATCDTGHPAPNLNCGCGLYSVTHPDVILRYAGSGFAIGLVKVFGTVLEYEHGYRSEYAQILTLIFIDPGDMRNATKVYGDVPMMTLDKAYEAYVYGFTPEEVWPYLFRRML